MSGAECIRNIARAIAVPGRVWLQDEIDRDWRGLRGASRSFSIAVVADLIGVEESDIERGLRPYKPVSVYWRAKP